MTGEFAAATRNPKRDHGGGLDAACARWGGARADWLDLSTGINPVPYPLPELPADAWTALPDSGAFEQLLTAARAFWQVSDNHDILPVPGASAPIARIPGLLTGRSGPVHIPEPTYNEHAAAFRAAGWNVSSETPSGRMKATVLVHPNNPDGRLWRPMDLPDTGLLVVDESFCDAMPEESLLSYLSARPNTLILKSFGKFWGLAGLRLGFVIGAPDLISSLREMIGPWAVSGPALAIGRTALADKEWAEATRARLNADAARLDALMVGAGAEALGGTPLFRFYGTQDAEAMQERLAHTHVWTRRFPYSQGWLRLGLPGSEADWQRLAEALS